jgi:hypothetical protein
MISVCRIKDEAKFTALLASRVPKHAALDYDAEGSRRYNTIKEWFNLSETTTVFEQVVRTPNGILYIPASDSFVDFRFDYYYEVDMLAVFGVANASTNNKELLKTMPEATDSFSSLIMGSPFSEELLDEARELGFIGQRFEIDSRFLV